MVAGLQKVLSWNVAQLLVYSVRIIAILFSSHKVAVI
jgi:hypothetical protein